MYDVWKEEKVSRMEYPQQVIGTDCRMLGEESEEGEDTSHDTRHTEKKEVDSP